jgi:hypothetical protein
MDNYTFILEHGPEDAGKMLCKLMGQSEKYLDKIEAKYLDEGRIPRQYDSVTACDICPVNENCCRDHNGFVEWLKSEYK